MYPRIFGVPSYFAAWAVAVVLGVAIALRHARREGVPPAQIWPVVVGLAVLLVVGAKLQAALQETVVGPPAVGVNATPAANPWLRGFQVPGGLALATLGLPLLCALVGAPTRRVGDALFPAVAAALAAARFGCFLHGCCFGIRTDLPWAVRFPATSPAFAWHFHSRWTTDLASESLPVHPLQLYYVALGVAAYLLGRRLWLTRRVTGVSWLATTAVFFAATFGLEWLRQERIHANLVLAAAATVTLGIAAIVLTARGRVS